MSIFEYIDEVLSEYNNDINSLKNSYVDDITNNKIQTVVISGCKLDTYLIKDHVSKCIFITYENTDDDFAADINILEYIEENESMYENWIETVDKFIYEYIKMNHNYYREYLVHYSCYDMSNYGVDIEENKFTSKFFIHVAKSYK